MNYGCVTPMIRLGCASFSEKQWLIYFSLHVERLLRSGCGLFFCARAAVELLSLCGGFTEFSG